jgi:phosphopantetheinyl transferase (holo-ACP synthase)
MVGNDVVDLLDPGLDAQLVRDRFDARICRAAECETIRSATDPARERWCHWAAKEASYKLLRKHAPETIFSPIRFEVDLAPAAVASPRDGLESERSGRVLHGAHRIELVLSCRNGAVHAVATFSNEKLGEPLVGLVRLDDEAAITPARHSLAVRELAIATIAAQLALPPGRFSIVKRGRIPEIHLDGAPIGADLSLSHHGHVVAFASRMPSTRQLERLAS